MQDTHFDTIKIIAGLRDKAKQRFEEAQADFIQYAKTNPDQAIRWTGENVLKHQYRLSHYDRFLKAIATDGSFPKEKFSERFTFEMVRLRETVLENATNYSWGRSTSPLDNIAAEHDRAAEAHVLQTLQEKIELQEDGITLEECHV